MNKILTVSQLNNYIKTVFEDELLLQNITVEGEIFECKFSGGNTYITLKEGEYILSCVKFGSRYEFETGDKVHVTGSMRFYPRGGKTTFVVTYASKVGLGELLVKLNELKNKLSSEGIFDNKKAMPVFVKKIALVTSKEGAVIHDFLEVLTRNGCDYIDVDVYCVKVQGDKAELTISKALDTASQGSYDIVVVARGGGSGQDLSCFNTEAVARAVYGCAFPVISAVGHEVDYTFSDFAATLRAGTPSIAAEQIVRINEAFLNNFYVRLDILKQKANALLEADIHAVKSKLSGVALTYERKTSDLKGKSLSLLNTLSFVCREKLKEAELRLKNGLNNAERGCENRLEEASNALRYASAMLESSSPLRILSQGYAKVLKNGESVTVGQVDIGDRLRVVMSDGTLSVTVDNKSLKE